MRHKVAGDELVTSNMTTVKYENLKDCPFCGARFIEIKYNKKRRRYYGYCITCMSRSTECADYSIAVSKWNRREENQQQSKEGGTDMGENMQTVVKYVSGNEFSPPRATSEKVCFRCSAIIRIGSRRLELASITTSHDNTNEATLSWDMFCEDCAHGIIRAAAKVSTNNGN